MSKPLPPQKSERHVIRLAAIEAGAEGCATVPEVTLVFGSTEDKSDTVTYFLDAAAAAIYSFAWPGPIREKDGNGNGNLQYLKAERVENDKALQVLLKPNAKNFTKADLILRLERDDDRKAIVEFDPLIGNGGGPRT